jgi:hypothetical protein
MALLMLGEAQLVAGEYAAAGTSLLEASRTNERIAGLWQGGPSTA